ncbi:MAG: hypothetical protein ACRC3Z_08335 [Phocaeicola sp.]
MSKVHVYFKAIDKVTMPILLWIHKLRSKKIQLWYDKQIVGDKKIIAKIKTKLDVGFDKTDNSIRLFDWQLSEMNVEELYCGLKHVAARTTTQNTEFVVIDSTIHNNSEMVLFCDAAHQIELPNSFIKVPSFTTVDELYSYCKDKGVFAFNIEDDTKFSHESGISLVQGAKVYKEIGTGRYWYLDMFHKDHYEVFDPTGKKHIGEAGIETGTIDTTKEDKSKQAIK